MATQRMRWAQEGEEIDEMNRVHVLLPGQEVEKGSLLYLEGQEARSQMERAKGQFKYLSNLVAAQEAAAKRKRDAAAAAALARRDEAATYTGKEAHVRHSAAIDALQAEREDGRGVNNFLQDDVFASSEVMMCPVCTDDVGTSSGASVMLPCGHLLCYPCCKDLVKVPALVPFVSLLPPFCLPLLASAHDT
jgi:hypothetical protein